MRLIRTSNLLLKEFFGSQIPKYAILSHTWGDNEIVFQDWKARDNCTNHLYNFKLEGAITQARQDGHEWIWIDTICIDK